MVKDVVSTVVSNKDVAFSHRPALAAPSVMPHVTRTVNVMVVIDCFIEVGSFRVQYVQWFLLGFLIASLGLASKTQAETWSGSYWHGF